MLYLLHQLSDRVSALRIFQYITFRTMMAAGTAFVISLLVGPWLIRSLRSRQCQELREDERVGSLDRAAKVGTPTMGGILMLFTTGISVFLWAAPANFSVSCAMGTFLFMGGLGFLDDHLKRRRGAGLSSCSKLIGQGLWVVTFLLLLKSHPDAWMRTQQLMVPLLKAPALCSMGLIGTTAFVSLILIGSTNAVNLTDGLDGLAVGCTSTAVGAYLVMAYVAGHYAMAEYLQIPFVKGGGELAVFCGALLGACLGFLWFNAHPARLFMGDTGSMALGGTLAAVAILIKQELVLLLVGGVFVAEALSVLIQVSVYKITRWKTGTGKRVFYRAPLHHHFEHISQHAAERNGQSKSESENRITIRFWIISLLCALAGLALLKIR